MVHFLVMLFVVPGLVFLAFSFMLLGAFFQSQTLAIGGILWGAVVSTVKQIFTVLV